jgi:hypothetical protein
MRKSFAKFVNKNYLHGPHGDSSARAAAARNRDGEPRVRSGPLWHDPAAINTEILRVTSAIDLLAAQPGNGKPSLLNRLRKRREHLQLRLAYIPVAAKRQQQALPVKLALLPMVKKLAEYHRKKLNRRKLRWLAGIKSMAIPGPESVSRKVQKQPADSL